MSARRFIAHNLQAILVIVGFVLVAGALAAQMSFNKHLLSRLENENMGMKILLADAIRGINHPAITDGPSRKVYMPEAKVVLPPQTKSQLELLYSYTPIDGDFPEQLSITTKVAQQSGLTDIYNTLPSKVFEKVGRAQACNRQALVIFNSTVGPGMMGENYREVYSKTLADGRKIRTYVTSDCLYTADDLVTYLKDIQSY